MTRRRPPLRLEARLVAEALSLALHPANVNEVGATQALGRLAGGNRTAMQRAVGSVASRLEREPSHVGQRALGFLRQALKQLDGQERG